MAIEIRVECYAGYKADERPLAFSMPGPAGRRYEVREVVDQWYGPAYQSFKVRADDGNFYILRHDFDPDGWTLEAFRRDSGSDSGSVEGRMSKAEPGDFRPSTFDSRLL